MPRRLFWSLLALLLLAPALARSAPSAPANFVVENAWPGVSFTTPVDIAWLPDGRALVVEKRGVVWIVRNGVKSSSPLLNIESAVLNASDRGLLSVAVHPQYFANHFVYFLYTVDPDSNNVETNSDAYARLVRYTVNFTDSSTVIASSRRILFGRTWSEGPASCSSSHTIGTIRFGTDGSLLVSSGDGASFSATDAGGLHPNSFTAGRIDSYQDIGSFRSQSLSSLNGKILRLNPLTGYGYASNPFADSNLNSYRSRVWAYGLRNPFRFGARPGTGSADTSAASPGVLFIGDVGYGTWEEVNVAPAGGRNFGWPCYEGAGTLSSYQNANPAHNGCNSFGTSDNPSSHTPPAVYVHHGSSASSPAGLSPGNASIGGVFYTGTLYPSQYRNQLIFGDYGQSWIRLGTVNSSHAVTAATNFIGAAESPVCLSADPVTKDILYISISGNQVRRIRYTGTVGNSNPVAEANANPSLGPAPLTTTLSSAGTFDPDGDAVTLSWSFGDNTGSTAANPPHTYTTAGTYYVVLTASDGKGGIGRDTVVVTATGSSTFPSTAIVDNFNRANGALGGSWTGDVSGLAVNGNRLTQTTPENAVMWNGATYGPNQEAFVTLAALGSGGNEFDLLLKTQGTSWTAGTIEVWYDHVARRLIVTTYAPTQGWVDRGTPLSITLAAGDRIGARALSDGTVEVYRNGTLIRSVSVGNWPFAQQGGRIGLYLVGTSGSALDDFGGGNVVFGNGNTPPTAAITAPARNAFYIAGQTIALTCTASDAQTATGALSYKWDVELQHNTHIHYSYNFATAAASFPGENHDDGTGVYFRIRLTVTDAGGLTAQDSLDIWPENDLSPSAITVSPAAPASTDSITHTFRIRNTGRLPARTSRWRLVRGTTLLAEGDVVVPALDSVTVSRRLGPAAAGTYTLRAVADTLGVVREISETNNATTRALTVTGTGGGTTFPATAVLDNFNRANGALGSNWLTQGSATIVSNQVQPGTADASPIWNGASFGANQEAYVTLSAITAAASEHDLMLKVQGTAWQSGHIEVFYDRSASRVSVYTYSTAQGWVLRGATISATFAAGDRLGARAYANGDVEVYRNTTLIGTRSVTAWPFYAGGGRIGFTVVGANASRLDDFGGGNIAAAQAVAAESDAQAAEARLPQRVALSSAYPNPTASGVHFVLELPADADVAVDVFDLQGRVVWSEALRSFGPGRWTLQWDGRTHGGAVAGAGVYLARIRAGATVEQRRFVRIP